MKYSLFLLPLFAAACLSSCGTKEQTEEQNTTSETTEAAAPVADTSGKVIELTDPGKLAPGVKVDRLTVVDFNAVWCGPCRQLAPVLTEMAQKYAGKADFISVDVDKYGELMYAWNLGQSIPVVLFLKPDGTSSHYVGTGDLLPADKFEALIKANL